ncbi:MAG: hypothetical protein HKN77_02085 [Woeseiaceae bacterium]|nr:hypothetical protein [Woeseiaceae bacterium]
MLPLFNLKAGDLFFPDTLPAADSLMPEGAGALDGDFADVLQANVALDISQIADAGELLPVAGNALPPAPLLPNAALPSTVQFENMPAVEFIDETSTRRNAVPVDNTLGQMLAEQTQRNAHIINAETLPADGPDSISSGVLEADVADPLLTPLLPVNASNVTTPPGPGQSIPAADSSQILPATSGAILTSIPGTPAKLTSVDGADPIGPPEPDNRPRVRLQAGVPDQLAQLAPAKVTVDSEVSIAAAPLQASNARSIFATDQSRNLRMGITAAADSTPTNAIDQRQAIAREEVPGVLRTVSVNVAQPATPLDTQLQIDSSQRFGHEMTAPLARQPHTSTLPTLSQTIDLPVQQKGWDNALAERVTVMANTRLQNAEIRLTPADLGPLKIRLAIEDGTANVSFHSQHVTTREAIEQALPRLREMLAENGLSLGQASVGDDGINQRERETHSNSRSQTPGGTGDSDSGEDETRGPASRRLDGLVDTFA